MELYLFSELFKSEQQYDEMFFFSFDASFF